tara:strand:- start:40314 stop:40859 length:546 start_codon:yes stop_codon:yes gene_type:complete
MAKRIFAVFSLLPLWLLLLTAVQAQASPISVDGCAKLARVVYSEVAAAAIYGPTRAGPWTINPGHGDVEICEHTARTVSRAFTSAMASAGITVTWGPDRDRSGDHCLSGKIEECYPRRDRPGIYDDAHAAALVPRTWVIVSQAVMREMYNPYSSDEIRFRDDDLKLRIGLALRSVRNTVDH